MKNKKGFTLVELLAVIVLIGLLMTIAIPSALKLSTKVKRKAYETKIDIIESAGLNYGQSNLSSVRRGTKPGEVNAYTCKMTYDGKNIDEIQYSGTGKSYDETKVLGNNEFWCIQITIQDLVNSNNLDYDEKNLCNDKCTTDDHQKYYNNVVLNPSTDYIINQCYVYVYYKYNRVYAVFDKKTCDRREENVALGKEYRRLV